MKKNFWKKCITKKKGRKSTFQKRKIQFNVPTRKTQRELSKAAAALFVSESFLLATAPPALPSNESTQK
jgi:hypothetical protein